MATYQLGDVRALIAKSRSIVTEQATLDALALGFDDEDIEHVVCVELETSHFYKTMESEQRPGLWQDVYKLRYRGMPLYVKLQIRATRNGSVAVVISFKRDESSRGA